MAKVPEERTFICEDVDEFMRQGISGKCRNRDNAGYRKDMHSGTHGAHWWGMTPKRDGTATTIKDVQAVVAEGWIEGMSRVWDRMKALEVPWVPSIKRRLTWTDEGDHLDMSRVYAGQIDVAWQKGKRREGSGPRAVRIVVDNCYHAGESPDEMQWRGIAAIAVAEALTEAGHNVELVTAFKLNSAGQWLFALKTKGLMMPLDVGSIAATTAFSGFFRGVGLGFAWTKYEHADHGCGMVAELTLDDLPSYGFDHVFLAHNQLNSQEAAQAWVTENTLAFLDQTAETA